MTTEIALHPFHIVEVTRFTVEADHELTENLRRYQEFYRLAYGENVKEAELLREMARRFMAQDKKFQGFGGKGRRSRAKRGSTTSQQPRVEGKLGFGTRNS